MDRSTTPRPERRSAAARRAPGALLGAAVVAVFVAGCSMFAAPSAPHPSRLSRTPEPVVVASDPPDEVETLPPDPAAGPDFAAAADALGDLDSYRVAVAARGLVASSAADGEVSMVATLVQGEQAAAQFSIQGVDGFTGGKLDGIAIGDEAWVKQGDGSWTASEGNSSDFDAAFNAMSPIELAGGFEALTPALSAVGTERKNGRAAIHYRADGSDAQAGAAGLTAGTADVWVDATAGWLVALAVDGTWDIDGTATPVLLRIDVTRVNDRANTVKRPG